MMRMLVRRDGERWGPIPLKTCSKCKREHETRGDTGCVPIGLNSGEGARRSKYNSIVAKGRMMIP